MEPAAGVMRGDEGYVGDVSCCVDVWETDEVSESLPDKG